MALTDVHRRYSIPDRITMLIDTREKYPLMFPDFVRISHPELTFKEIPIKVETKKVALPYGDYALEGYESVCAVERKATQLELFKNLNHSVDRIRQSKAFRKLSTSCEYPYILIEASPAELLANNPKIKNPEIIVHRIGLALAKYNLRAIFLPWRSRSADVRRKVGTLITHIMLGCILSKTYDVPAVLLDDLEESC